MTKLFKSQFQRLDKSMRIKIMQAMLDEFVSERNMAIKYNAYLNVIILKLNLD